MEFNIKLQELRKQKGLTQEALAEALFVSRTAISKWESGRGYPNIESLKAIAKFFGVTVDELLCSEELLTLAEEDTKQKELNIRTLVFGLLDVSVGIFLFLPFFGEKTAEAVRSVSLLSLATTQAYLRFSYLGFVILSILWGVFTLALQNSHSPFLLRNKSKVSLVLNAVGVLLFTVSMQPYPAALLFVYLMIKVLILIKKQ